MVLFTGASDSFEDCQDALDEQCAGDEEDTTGHPEGAVLQRDYISVDLAAEAVCSATDEVEISEFETGCGLDSCSVRIKLSFEGTHGFFEVASRPILPNLGSARLGSA